MKTDRECEQWFKGKPAEPILRRVREVMLSADKRMAEHTKYGTVSFYSGADFASFVQHDKPAVRLMFNRGGIIPGNYPHMEGSGRQVRFMSFDSVKTVDSRAGELARIVVAWCELMAKSPRRPRTQPASRA